ncbi:MAG: alpha/beta hydrolase [Candidatus Marinimicrobia bacterium]|nr:alpha/beta hydrolase [Candidatus Neomarinimicrobiota bacterium]
MITLFWILFALFLFLVITRVLTYKMYDLKLTPHTETPEKLDIPFEEVRFPTENQCSLYGWWIPVAKQPESAPTLILVHGWSRNLGRMLRYIQHLHPLNYNLLAFDARHHGSSDRDNHSSMHKFGQDIHAAVQYACSRGIDPAKVGAIGLSIGGAGLPYAATLGSCLKAVVTVGAPAHPVDVMKREFKRYHIPGLLGWVILKQIETKIGVSYELFAPVNNIAKATAAFFVIHGDQDDVVLPSQGEKLKNAARDNQCDYWSIPERGHSNCHHEPGFWDKVDRFLQKNLNNSV